MLFDLSVEHQSYVEDCEVCCRPISVTYTAENGEVTWFEAGQLE